MSYEPIKDIKLCSKQQLTTILGQNSTCGLVAYWSPMLTFIIGHVPQGGVTGIPLTLTLVEASFNPALYKRHEPQVNESKRLQEPLRYATIQYNSKNRSPSQIRKLFRYQLSWTNAFAFLECGLFQCYYLVQLLVYCSFWHFCSLSLYYSWFI